MSHKKFSWFYQSNLVEIGRGGGRFLFPRWKKLGWYFTLRHIPFTVKEFQYTSFTFLSNQCKTSLIKKAWINFIFLGLCFKLGIYKNFWKFRWKHLWWSLFLIMLQAGRCFPVKFLKSLRMPLFPQSTSNGCFCNFQVNEIIFSF